MGRDTGTSAAKNRSEGKRAPAMVRATLTAEVSAQLAAGRCNIVPLAELTARPFRTELTVEQASLFVSNDFQGDAFVRESETRHHATGEAIRFRMMVGRTHAAGRARGVLRQSHQDVFYKVLQAWGEQAYPVGEIRGKVYGTVRLSAYSLVKAVFPSSDNGRVYRRVRELLRDLQAIPIVLENVHTWQGHSDRVEFTLLSDVTWSERKVDDDGIPTSADGESLVTILLSSMVTDGFLHRNIKVLLAEPYDSLDAGKAGRRNETARLLYPFLDNALSQREVFSAPLKELAERFGLKPYQYASQRKEQFAKAISALNGKPICEGRSVLQVSCRGVAGSNDYVLHAVKKPAATP